MQEPPTVASLLSYGSLLESSSTTARLDVEILIAHALGRQRAYLYAHREDSVDASLADLACQLIDRRAAGEPIAYILGRREFWSLPLEVDDSVLIPRPETELLVEKALERLPPGQARLLDLGTGSGAIALAVASERSDIEVLATDQSSKALRVAHRNRERLKLSNVNFLESDWFSGIDAQRFNMIVSNPPYVAPNDRCLGNGDLRFEPVSALVAEDDGYAALDRLVSEACDYLSVGGWLLLEHGESQGQRVRDMMNQCGYAETETLVDFAGHDRVSIGKRR